MKNNSKTGGGLDIRLILTLMLVVLPSVILLTVELTTDQMLYRMITNQEPVRNK